MNTKIVIAALIVLLPLTAYAAGSSKRWTVPENVTRIQVKSWTKEGEKVFSYEFDVEPGQVFEIITQ